VLALGIRYLNGFVAATEPDGRGQPEWPPHPARVFMALAAAYFQTGEHVGERDALRWLESLPAPALSARGAMPRKTVTQFVPVNDKAGEVTKPPTAIIQSAPQVTRDRQPRTFARAWLEDETAYLIWPATEVPATIASDLSKLCAKVSRIGHSTSLVHMWVAEADEVGFPNWIPDDERAEIHLRVVGSGTLADLERRYNATAVDAYGELLLAAEDVVDRSRARSARERLRDEFGNLPPSQHRPQVSCYQGYARAEITMPAREVPGGDFSPHPIVFGLEWRHGPLAALGLPAALQVVSRWREALVAASERASERVRALVSGHGATGAPLEEAHLALVPLAFVGHAHADGHLLGLGAFLPACLDGTERREVLRVLGQVEELRLGRLGVWGLTRDMSDRPAWNLQPNAWTAYPDGATHWSSVTPVAFDRHPKARDPFSYRQQVAEMVAAACTAIGLPRPREVVTTPASAHLGVPFAHAFPRLTRKDGTERRHTHVIVIFEEPVRGPVMLGAGRYRGYGLCRPMEER